MAVNFVFPPDFIAASHWLHTGRAGWAHGYRTTSCHPHAGSRRLAVFLKIVSICLLIPFLLIPLGMTNGVLRERQGYQAQATAEIAGIWGRRSRSPDPCWPSPTPIGRRWSVPRW
ncbi:MAG: inner membrane CreD family protein [Lacunisphaera sp.]